MEQKNRQFMNMFSKDNNVEDALDYISRQSTVEAITPIPETAKTSVSYSPDVSDRGHVFSQWMNTGIRLGYVSLFEQGSFYKRTTRAGILTPDYYLLHYIDFDNVEKTTKHPRALGFRIFENKE